MAFGLTERLMPRTHHLKLPSATPRQQAENKSLWNDGRSPESADFFTIGYSGRKLEELLGALVKAGVQTLIDVRQNPVSMYRPEVSKANLRTAVQARGLQYLHLPELGVPRDVRALAIHAGSKQVIWDWYDQEVASPYLRRNLHHFLNASEHPVAFMCAELDPSECHRHRLFVALEEHGLRGYEL